MDTRIFVEKKEGFQIEAKSLLNELNNNLGLHLKSLRFINVYDLFNFTSELLDKAKYQVFAEIVTDNVYDSFNLENKKYIALEYLPGQFDQRASSAIDCTKLIDPTKDINIKSSRLYLFDDDIKEEELLKVSKYLLNPVEARFKDLSKLILDEKAEVKEVKTITSLRGLKDNELNDFINEYHLAMNSDDLKCVIDYFNLEKRDPTETELRILDTYWSDHCRHTTFSTKITHIKIDESFIKNDLEEALDLYYKMREDVSDSKNICLMDMATIGAKYLKRHGYLDDLEVSDENNACSIYVTVDVNGKDETWLLMFKNETHNHPTEIEPFGGASTCLGGAIRDPLSGRSYVYQAMRVTGAGNIYEDIENTIPGKLPQRVISQKAALGYSSYGNQIGLATTHVRELYHEGYVAKRLEVGAVVGAVKLDAVRREAPTPGDVILMFGGRTGRDGIGGATGSSKKHNLHSIEECSSEVQKGNAPEERKIERLFRNKEAVKLIKKSNDFGAGGVSVAIGELADGLDIYLDRVKTKYSGLNATELAISESQERMAVVVSKADMEKFIEYCHDENLEVIHIADVTSSARLVMYYHGIKYVDLKRSFIDSAGATHYAKLHVLPLEKKNPFVRDSKDLKKDILNILADKNVTSQKGLIEMFDSTVGRSTVLMPFGGKYQATETQVSAQKLPVLEGVTDTASVMAFGYDPYLTSYSMYHGSQYAVIDACAKVVASGAKYDKMRFSYQEYFEKMQSEVSWSKPFLSLLGAIKIQNDLKLPSIGGKDSMSGTFDNISVPPMLMAFGITTAKASNLISPEFKEEGNFIYYIKHDPLDNFNPNIEVIKHNFNLVNHEIEKKNIISAYAIGFGGAIEALAKMSFGNRIGFVVDATPKMLLSKSYGSFIVESKRQIKDSNAILIGNTASYIKVNDILFTFDELMDANRLKFNQIYKDSVLNHSHEINFELEHTKKTFTYPYEAKETPRVYIPSFPGTNSDYDTLKAFEACGAKVINKTFKNLTSEDVLKSIHEMAQEIDLADIFVLAGGFSAGDEPDGSGKFIAACLNNVEVKDAIERLISRKGLILGICNGFQALIKSGLLPYGHLGMVNESSPTLFRNDINRHISQIVRTKVMSTSSPWLSSFKEGEVFSVAVSHGEGKFVVSESLAQELFKEGEVAFTYVDLENEPTTKSPYNPNGSYYAIEGIVSKDGLILGKMGHSERYEENVFKNISGNKCQNIFQNAVNYFRKVNE